MVLLLTAGELDVAGVWSGVDEEEEDFWLQGVKEVTVSDDCDW